MLQLTCRTVDLVVAGSSLVALASENLEEPELKVPALFAFRGGNIIFEASGSVGRPTGRPDSRLPDWFCFAKACVCAGYQKTTPAVQETVAHDPQNLR
jgi:hypothetical protein